MSAPKTLSVEDDLDIVWTKALDGFMRTSKIKNLDREMSIGDVLKNVGSKDMKETTKTRAKPIISNILTCVQLFGEIVATASGIIFPAGQQCFNALNFVIVAVQKYQKMFEDLTALLERVSVFVGTLRIYLEENKTEVILDRRLRPVIYRVLEHFMAIMTLTWGLQERKGRAWSLTKTFLFGGDDGVTEALATLETLVSQFVQVQVAVIGQDLSEAARGIRRMEAKMELVEKFERTIVSSLGKREEREKIEDMKKQLQKWLCLKENKEPWREYHNTLRDQRIKDTGAWLCKNNKVFTQWCDLNVETDNSMVIAGDSGRGKSFLTSAVIDHLQDRQQEAPNRTMIAYNYHQATDAKDPPLKELEQDGQRATALVGTATSRALRNIVYQLVVLDSDYRNFVYGKLEGDACKMDAINIWNNLIASHSPKRRSACFIILDGMQREDQDLIRAMMAWSPESTSHLRVRIFVTATKAVFSGLGDPKKPFRVSLDPVPNGERQVPSIDDVKKITEKCLAEASIFQHKNISTRGVQRQVLEVLTRQIQNDYSRLSLMLNEISQCVNTRQIERILKRVEEPVGVKLGRQVRALNSKLTSEEIKEVNALISCLEHFPTPSYRHEGVPCSLAQQYVDVRLNMPRLTPLSERVEQHYSLLFEVDAFERIKWRYTEIQQYLRKDFEDQQTMKEIYKRRGKTTSRTDLEELDLLEVVIQNSLNSVFAARGADLFERYGLAEYFLSLRGQHTELICANERSNRYSVLSVCLRVLCEDMGPRSVDELRSYARRHLFEHLRWDANHSLTAKEVQTVGQYLVKLLRHDATIERWSDDAHYCDGITACFPSNVKKCGLKAGDSNTDDLTANFSKTDDPKGDDLIAIWFNKKHLLEGLVDPVEKKWFSSLQNTTPKGRPGHWDYAIQKIVEGWYKRKLRTWDAIELLARRQILGLKLEHNLLTMRVVQQYERYWFYGKWVLKTCDDAIKKDPNTWWALFYSAKLSISTLRDDGDGGISQALNRLKSMNSASRIDEDFRRLYWTDVLPLLAHCQNLLRDSTGALASYAKMMESVDSRGSLTIGSLRSFAPDEIFEFFKTAGTTEVPGETHHWFHELILSIKDSSDTLSVKLAAHHGNDWRFICQGLENVLAESDQFDELKAAADPSKEGKEDPVGKLTTDVQKNIRLLLAFILWHESDSPDDRGTAISIWEELKATDILLNALIKQSERKTLSELSTPVHGIRLADLIYAVWWEFRAEHFSAYMRTRFVVAQFFMDLGDLQTTRIWILTMLKDKDYGDDLGSDEQLQEYGMACFILGDDDLGQDLFSHMSNHSFDVHEDCERICGAAEEEVETRNYLCRDCMWFLRPPCVKALESGVWTAGFCDPKHRRIELRAPIADEDGAEGTAADLVRKVGVKHGWLKASAGEGLEEKLDNLRELPRTSAASVYSINEVTTELMHLSNLY